MADTCRNLEESQILQQPEIHLPTEIIIYIMEFLPLADRISASQVCHQWYEASREQKLHYNEVVILHDNISRPLQVFENSYGTFVNFVFKEVELGAKLSAFWDKFCPSMCSLGIYSCDVSERTFVEILARCVQLQSLRVNGCRELLMSGRVLEVESDVLQLLRKTLRKLKELSLSYNRYLSDALFNRFVAIAPNLEELSVTGCQISFHMGLYRKFYSKKMLANDNIVPSESVLTFPNILNFIISQAKKLKKLTFGHTLIDNAAVTQLAQVPSLNLMSLHLQSCDQLTNVGIIALTEHQKLLTELDLSECSRLTDHSLLAICNNLTNLTILNIRSCRAISDISVSEMCRLQKLKDLNLSHCELVTGKGIVQGLCSKVNPSFRRLNLSVLPLDEDTVCQVAEKLPGLTHLDLSWCFIAVTDRSVQAICTHLIWLHTLKLTACNRVTDSGLTGIQMTEEEENVIKNDMPIYEDSQTLDSTDEDPMHKISLRSRAEKEIVQDARRKQLVSQKCEDQTQGTTVSGNSLERLKGLRFLDICGCNRITDVSLKYAFNFPSLQHLDISRCQQVTRVGLTYLAVRNPSIETLIMSHCYNVIDEGLLSIVKCLYRLKHLDIKGCTHLTDVSIEAIGKYCCNMKYLDVSNCPGMTAESVDKMEKQLPVVHTVHRHGLRPRIQSFLSDESIAEMKPIPPPPPRKKFSFLRC
ncbi:F-box/LRR-repeat protein 14 isoform X1 [Anabrus simplex]|uniref:F-box/LRR-repeat protein 14 isoform X1 n=1 Tax=Anabrus simplex TaxID=316456 RepID=UPI0035A388E2